MFQILGDDPPDIGNIDDLKQLLKQFVVGENLEKQAATAAASTLKKTVEETVDQVGKTMQETAESFQ